MSRSPTQTGRCRRTNGEFGFFKEIDMFFQEKSPVHQTMRRLVRRLDRAKIPHAVMGGMAVYAHGYERTTNDVDILLTPAGFEEFKRRFVPKNYQQAAGRSRRYIDRQNQQTFDILMTGMFPGTGQPGPISYPNPAKVSQRIKKIPYVDLATLVQLKLAASRWKDFADVVELIRVHNLDESFAQRLHSTLRSDFIECLEEKRREDEYEAQEG